jgi:hypothetical protein
MVFLPHVRGSSRPAVISYYCLNRFLQVVLLLEKEWAMAYWNADDNCLVLGRGELLYLVPCHLCFTGLGSGRGTGVLVVPGTGLGFGGVTG